MVEKSITVIWSPAALRDLDRFAAFLLDSQPLLSADIAAAIVAGADSLAGLPMMGRPMAGKPYRQLVIVVCNATYVLRYRFARQHVVILRVFHGREERQ